MINHTRVALCIATNRGPEIQNLMREWSPYFAASSEGRDRLEISVYVHEDHASREFELAPPASVRLVHTCQGDIEAELGARAWIIPRKSGASRSFPMYLAWRDGADYLITMDDDCLPPESEPGAYFRHHLGAFRLDRWFRTIDGEYPRGIPYGPKGALPVLLNHGVWTGVPDLDGPSALVRGRWPADIGLRPTREVVPPGMWFPLCAMNVCYSRRAIPAAYNLLMSMEEFGFDRFDDIWSGLFLKRVADHLGCYITTGIPFVRHTKASNPFSNLRKEALGIHLHEDFWKHVEAAPLEGAHTVASAYARLARWIARFPREYPSAPSPKGYFERLADAMRTWVELFPEVPGEPSERAPAGIAEARLVSDPSPSEAGSLS